MSELPSTPLEIERSNRNRRMIELVKEIGGVSLSKFTIDDLGTLVGWFSHQIPFEVDLAKLEARVASIRAEIGEQSV